VLASLALVMVVATLMLSAVWVARHEATLRAVLGRALLAESRRPEMVGYALVPGTDWWSVSAEGKPVPRGGVSEAIDDETLALAAAALDARAPVLRPGSVWESIRFARPGARPGEAVVARLPRSASVRMRLVPLAVAGAVVVAEALIFTAFGAVLLRRRVTAPLQRLASAARELAQGVGGVRVPVEGTRETSDLARAFNEMTDSLEGRTEALGKAVSDLRRTNADLRTARAGLDRAERLAAVGRLAAGVAHEVGNPMGAILAFLDLAGRDPGLSDATRGHLERAGREGERVRVILRQLLDFSRPGLRASPSPLDLTDAARESQALLEAQRLYAAVRFDVVAEPAAPLALSEPSAVAQILLNLTLNAADAVADQPDPRVRLWIRPAWLGARGSEDPSAGAAFRAPDAVECVVADTGCGIDEGDRERIFDPFFTTKPPGEGTGLGLSNAARLAEELEGVVELVEPPHGFRTAVALRLPSISGCRADRTR
jgi:signal transduction histidine kinase